MRNVMPLAPYVDPLLAILVVISLLRYIVHSDEVLAAFLELESTPGGVR